jgi:hypothetical protein
MSINVNLDRVTTQRAAVVACLPFLFASASFAPSCGGGAAPQLDPWTQQTPSLQSPSISPQLLVLKCAYADEPNKREIPSNLLPAIQTLDFYIGSFMGGFGVGSLWDYYRDVSYDAIELQTKILGWYDAPFGTSQRSTLSRAQRVEQCANAIPEDDAQTLDFRDYAGIIAVMNDLTDGGACDTGRIPMTIHGVSYSLGCAIFDRNSLYTAFASHEVGHVLGLPHSYDNTTNAFPGAGPGEYHDYFDEMSALATGQFTWRNFPAEGAESSGGAGPGFNVPNLLFLNALSAPLTETYSVGSPQRTISIAALSLPTASSAVAIEIVGTDPSYIYTVEYRQAYGWDQGIPADVVLIHKYQQGQSPYSYLQEGPASGGWAQGDTWTSSDEDVSVSIQRIDPSTGTATVSIRSSGFGRIVPPPRLLR